MKQTYKNQIQRNKGQVMLITMLFIVMLSTLIFFGVSAPVVRDYRVATEALYSRQSYFLAESSTEDVFYRVKNNMTVAASETLYDGTNYNTITTSTTQSGQTQVVAVSNVGGRERTVTGTFAQQGGSVNLSYAAQAGQGGITLTGSSYISGNVYVNGTLTGNGSPTYVTGSATAAATQALTVDQTNGVSGTPTNTIIFGQTSASQDTAQSFQLSTEVPLNKAQIYVKKTGSPSNATVRIATDNAGVPSTTYLATGTLTAANVTTSYNWVDVTFTTNPTLTAGTTYWLVFDATPSASNYYTVAASSGGYANGAGASGTYGGTWSATTPTGLDLYFKIYLGGFSSLINGGPSQYNQMRIGTTSGNAYADTVNYSSVSGTIYCQTGSGDNKTCNTSLPSPQQQPLPISSSTIAAWEAQAVAGGTTTGNVSISGVANQSIGPQKIVGNLSVSGSGILNVTGTLWVTGNLSVSGAAIMRLASSYGAQSGAVVVDGTITISGSSPVTGSGTTGSYLVLLTNSNCPTSSSCSGANAIDISGAATSIVLIAQNGTVNISGSGTARSVVGYQINLSGATNVTYDSGLSSLGFGGTSGGSSWSVASWKETQ